MCVCVCVCACACVCVCVKKTKVIPYITNKIEHFSYKSGRVTYPGSELFEGTTCCYETFQVYALFHCQQIIYKM